MRKIVAISCGAALWFAFSGATAHHSNAPHYDRERPITIEGVVEEFEFVNPHAFLHIRAENESGESEVWACEMQTANTLKRQGWTEDRFTVGQSVTVSGIAARRDPLGCSFNSAELTDGTTIARSGAVVPPTEDASGDAPRPRISRWRYSKPGGSVDEGQKPRATWPGSRFGAARRRPAHACGSGGRRGLRRAVRRSFLRMQRLKHHPSVERAWHADGYRAVRRSRGDPARVHGHRTHHPAGAGT